MRQRNLLIDPCWSASELGKAIPNSPHAVSVALPRWQDVINYEEKEANCMQSLKAIYPRFGLNPLVKEIASRAIYGCEFKKSHGWPFPNLKVAEKAKLYCEKKINGKVIIKEISGLYCLITNEDATPFAKAFWQHTGLGASSRQAAIALKQEHSPSKKQGENARIALAQRLSDIYKCHPSLIDLHPSGMSALSTALGAIKAIHPKKTFIQVGFPYVDVLKLPQEIFGGSELFINTNLEVLAKELRIRKPAAVIVELPSNPMLQCIDLPAISKLAHENGALVVADDTIGSALNIDPLPYADLIFSSLTKSFAGRGDILAGSLTISPQSRWRKELSEMVPQNALAPLSDADAIALEESSRDIKVRIPRLNQACLSLKRKLEQHPQVARVLHPEYCQNFKKIMRADAGYGCLLSFELVEGLSKAQHFYNSLRVCKGPSLGTKFTLACPYVLLAHYEELDWAERCGVPSHLLRVSVGLEEPRSLWARFKNALES
ncbi:PLP-dependent transferase [Prochlorococcus sp. MIT 1223]|uniref:PLP-dependent transferase n=1 Tax=Prochlorococcus sp. MIT 1223 TaxID=3096217 RepID=UPI002A75AF17|nr:PLP-dependent transferase [Prochlorococcus sp. MIT 1223]